MAQVDASHCRRLAPPERQQEAELVCIEINSGLEVAYDDTGMVLLTFDVRNWAGGHGVHRTLG